MVIRIVKRNGSVEPFDVSKIKRALLLAFNARQPGAIPNVAPLVTGVLDRLRSGVEDKTVRVDDVSDMVEDTLMDSGHYDVARAFIQHRAARVLASSKRARGDNLAMTEFIHADRYAKWWPETQRRETYAETCARVQEMYCSMYPEWADSIVSAFDYVRRRDILPSMRSMQFGGDAALANHARIYNCSFTLVDRVEVFSQIFWLLLSGCGVGYSVQMQHVEKLGVVRAMSDDVSHHVVADTIEGWGDAAGHLFHCAFVDGSYPEFAYHEIRPQGSWLKTTGGRAPGHRPLKDALEACRAILAGAAGRRLRPLEASDMICLLADAVLAGGIRRASLIGLFSLGDTEMMFSKAKGNFRPAFGADPGLNAWRQMVNISPALLRGSVDRSDFDRLLRVARENFGDPGFCFVADLDNGTNPCGEIGLRPVIMQCNRCLEFEGSHHEDCDQLGYVSLVTGFSFCNLCEINAATVKDTDDFVARCQAASLIGTLQASMTDFSYLGPVSIAIARREALLGVGLTGIQDNLDIIRDATLLGAGVRAVASTNELWAGRLGINRASRLTTIKPSGTASIAIGCVGSGIHPHWAKRYFRRVTCEPDSATALWFRSRNPHMVETRPDGKLSLVFPIEAPEGAKTVADSPAIGFCEAVSFFYQHWVMPGTAVPDRAPGLTHNVSCTVTLREGDLSSVADWIWANRSAVCAMSFVPDTLDLIFPFAPMQAVRTVEDEARWDRLCAAYRAVDWGSMVESVDGTSRSLTVACAAGGGGCES